MREKRHPGATESEVRDGFLTGEAVDLYKDDPRLLLQYIEDEKGTGLMQRMLALRSDTYTHLQNIAKTIDHPDTPPLRAILSYTVDHLDDEIKQAIPNELATKISLLESQIEKCQETMKDIMDYIRR